MRVKYLNPNLRVAIIDEEFNFDLIMCERCDYTYRKC